MLALRSRVGGMGRIGRIVGIGLQIVQLTTLKFTVSLKNTGTVVADFSVRAWAVLPGSFGPDWKTWDFANARVEIPFVTITGLSPGITTTITSAATTPIAITPGTYDMVYIAYLAAGGDPLHFIIKAGELVIVPPAPPPTGLLYGFLRTVLNEYIPYKTVVIGDYSTQTDSVGNFRMNLPGGTYRTLTVEGYEPYTFLNPVAVVAGGQTSLGYLYLEPIGFEEARISGVVKDASSGIPIGGAYVSWIWQGRVYAEGMTGSSGYYELICEPWPSPFRVEDCSVRVHHPNYYDAESEPFDLGRGEVKEVNFNLTYLGELPTGSYIYEMNYMLANGWRSGWRDLWNVIQGQLEIPTTELGKATYISVWFYCKKVVGQSWQGVRSTITRPDGTKLVRKTDYYPPGAIPDTGEWNIRADGSGGISPIDQIGLYHAKYEMLGDAIWVGKSIVGYQILHTVELTLLKVI